MTALALALTGTPAMLAQGPVPASDDFEVNTLTTLGQSGGAVGALADGGFVVTLSSWGPSGPDFSVTSIQGRRFDADGTPAGDEFQINTYVKGSQSEPVVVATADGSFVTVWKGDGSYGSDQSYDSIQGQRHALDGTPLGGEFQVNSQTLEDQHRHRHHAGVLQPPGQRRTGPGRHLRDLPPVARFASLDRGLGSVSRRLEPSR